MGRGSPSSSTKNTRTSAAAAISYAFEIPKFSISSSDSRKPAVSRKLTANPCKSTRHSITSRVVPATSEVIAACRPTIAFNSVDLPTLGAPIIATVKPVRIFDAIIDRSNIAAIDARVPSTKLITSTERSSGISSSEKSILASSSAAARNNLPRQISPASPKRPSNTRMACWRCDSVSASIRSDNAST